MNIKDDYYQYKIKNSTGYHLVKTLIEVNKY